PWQYLGWKIMTQSISPQKVRLVPHIKTLNDLQQLLGAVNWIWPLLGITTEILHPL
ncbi:PO113 protein, partial [Anseranas semipalmata]|nr:PO113 protein [Anseranas semipalmata]